MKVKVGFGYDVHKLAENRKFILCGIEVEHPVGLLGHSDADVAVHALIDALCGAANLGDIGNLFPDNDDRYKGISSILLLEKTLEKVRERGFSFGNADITIVAQAPKLAPYIPQMKENLRNVIGCDIDDISLKATTEEHLGFTGRKEGVAAYAVALLEKLKG